MRIAAAIPLPPPRPVDALDRVARSAIVDLHADTPLHNLPLEGDGQPGLWMQIWMAIIHFLALFVPSLRNFFRHVTRDTLDHAQRGVQVFSIVTQGLPPFFDASFSLYTQLPAQWPEFAMDTPMNAALFQLGWIYREIARNRDRLEHADDLSEVRGAIARNHVGVQIGIEGAFPLVVRDGDVDALRRFLRNPHNGLPPDLPLPSEAELATTEGRLRYFQRVGVQYLGLNHLNSSCYTGSDLWGADDRHAGLSDDGRALIRSMDRAGMLLDLAHASQQAQLDVTDVVRRGEYSLPLLVSHSVHQLGNEELNWRMTRPEVLDAVRCTGGVVGIMFARTHLPDPTVSGIVDQIDAVVRRIGIDYVAFGSDADGFVGLPFDDLGDGFDQVIAEMRRRGYSEDDICKVRGGNYLHALQRRERILRQRATATARVALSPA